MNSDERVREDIFRQILELTIDVIEKLEKMGIHAKAIPLTFQLMSDMGQKALDKMKEEEISKPDILEAEHISDLIRSAILKKRSNA